MMPRPHHPAANVTHRIFLAFAVVLAFAGGGCASRPPLKQSTLAQTLDGKQAALVMLDADSGRAVRYNPQECAQRQPPCSTFKIWNTLIGLQLELIHSPEEPFYKWDGQKRSYDQWNQDLTLGQAFAVSCVPAFQALAERIGPERMNHWLQTIDYGDRNTSAGPTVFWLPARGRQTIMISPDEQAQLLRQLVRNEMPFDTQKVQVLKQVMRIAATDKGSLYGKTGTGTAGDGTTIAWFVGWVETREGNHADVRTFACIAHAPGLAGTDVRSMVRTILEKDGLL